MATGAEVTFIPEYLHFIAHTAAGDAVRCSCAGPEVSESLDGQRITTVSVPGHFEVQVTIVWKITTCWNCFNKSQKTMVVNMTAKVKAQPMGVHCVYK